MLLASATVACAGDPVCVTHACGILGAAQISVTAPNAPTGVSGLTIVVNGDPSTIGDCEHCDTVDTQFLSVVLAVA